MATINITVQSLLNAAQYDLQIVDTAGTIGDLKTAIETNFSYSADWFDLVFNNEVLDTAETIGSYGIVEGSALRTHNKISRLTTLQDRQVAKLELSHLERLDLGNTRPYYDISELPTYYSGNVVVDNPNPDGLILGRPWSAIPGSLLFSGSNYLTVDGNASTAMGTGDFTWECFVYPTSSTDYQAFIDTRTNPLGGGDTTGFYFGTNFNTLNPIYYTNGLQLASSVAMTLNDWNHVALTRHSGTVTLWVNGVSGGTKSDTTNLSEQRVFIGGDAVSGGLTLTGYLSNLRMLKGSVEYTAPFTPPIGPLPVIDNTVLLLNTSSDTNFLKDSSTNNFTITNTGGVASDSLNPFPAE